MEYPTCEAFAKVSDKINEFIDWYDQSDLVLARWIGNRWEPYHGNLRSLLMEYYGIDEAELERERSELIRSVSG